MICSIPNADTSITLLLSIQKSASYFICLPKNALVLSVFFLISILSATFAQSNGFQFPFFANKFDDKFSRIDKEIVQMARDQAREMFFFGYNSYMRYFLIKLSFNFWKKLKI